MEQVDPVYEIMLLNQQDVPPNILRGCSGGEIGAIAIGCFLFCAVVCCLLALLLGVFFIYGLAASTILASALSWIVIGLVGKAKTGKPNGWCLNITYIFMHKYFGVKLPFIRYEGQWNSLRELKNRRN
ncbi:MAG: DUF3487 family protein [Pseudomonadales bacterium]